MKHKKLAALVATVFMMVSSSTVFAAGSGKTTVIEAVCRPPVIQVTIPTTGEVYINPLELPVEINSESVKKQIVATPVAIHNESELKMDVDVSVLAAINKGSDMTLTTASTKESTSTLKKAFIYFEIQSADSSSTSAVKWAEEYEGLDNQMIVRTTTKSKKKILRLAEKGQKGSYAVFRLSGDCIANPKKEWNGNDGLKVTVSFTFTPIPYGAEEE